MSWYMADSCVKLVASYILFGIIIQTGSSPVAQGIAVQKSRVATHDDVIDQGEPEQTTSPIDNHVSSSIDSRINRLESLVQILNANMKEIMETTSSVSEMRTENAELRRMLGNFEYFFGSLYAEKPEAFDPEFGVEKRMSALNQYLGNKEAELAGLRPSPVATVDLETNFDTELLGKALTQLTQENSKLAEKVAKLQEKVDITSPSKGDVRDDVTKDISRRSERDVRSRDDVGGFTDTELETIERMVAQDLERVLTNLSRHRNVSREVTYADVDDDDMMTLEEDLFDIQVPSRRRKVTFSAARTSSLFGRNESHQVVSFDNVFVDKGHDFDVDNGTYNCEVTGFYYISFSVRSYDGFHIGVTLHKNDDVITAIYTDRSDRNVMESQSVILHLEAGDRLFLLLGPSDRYAIYSDARNYCTLNIFLLYRGY